MAKLFTPAEIVSFLDEYVIGQDDAKRVLGVAVYNHYKRVNMMLEQQNNDGIEIKKSNVMMLGPTGSGKTLLVSTLARIIETPFVLADSTAIVASDDISEEINRVFGKLLDKADGDIKKAEAGIVFFDEIDKLVTGINRLKGESIQQILLKIIEGTVLNVPYKGGLVELDTNNILFVVGGAFVELQSIVRSRLGEKDTLLLSEYEVVKQAVSDDFATFGLIPEFCGRVPVIVVLEALSREALKVALVKPKNSLISQYKKMLEVEKVEIEFAENSLDKIAEMAEELKTGARGLRTICERFMTEIMYDIPNQQNLVKIIITDKVVAGEAKPEYFFSVSQPDMDMMPLTPLKLRNTNPDTDDGGEMA